VSGWFNRFRRETNEAGVLHSFSVFSRLFISIVGGVNRAGIAASTLPAGLSIGRDTFERSSEDELRELSSTDRVLGFLAVKDHH
jgi:hypothetical protein